MDRVNERSSWFNTVSFTDENGDPVVPETVFYRIDDVGTGSEIRGDTEIEVFTTQANIVWEPTDTAILDETHPYETRRMTVSWTYQLAASPPASPPAGGEGHAEYLLDIVNLTGVMTPSPA